MSQILVAARKSKMKAQQDVEWDKLKREIRLAARKAGYLRG